MAQKTVSTSLTPSVSIQSVQGSLQVKGWDRSQVLVRADDDALVLEKQDDQVLIRCKSDCVVRLPHESSVFAATVQGNARFKLLEGELKIDQILGSLEIRDADQAQIGKVHGNLMVKQTSGDLLVEHVLGSALATDVQGRCLLKRVSGNVDLRDTEGDLETSAQGNARVQLCLLAGKQYQVDADGDVQCILPEDASARVNLHSRGRRIQVRLPDGKTTLAEENYVLTLGNGEAEMTVSAGGGVLLVSREADWAEMDDVQSQVSDAFSEFTEEFGEQISGEMEVQIETQMEILNEQLAKLESLVTKSGMSQAEADKVIQRAQEARARANARAQEKMRRAQQKMDRKLEAAQRKVEMKMRSIEQRGPTQSRKSWKFEWPPAPPAPPEPVESVSDEERLIILKMLEQKKITMEEAERLLAALEGK
jgi:hypothetical protein